MGDIEGCSQACQRHSRAVSMALISVSLCVEMCIGTGKYKSS